MIRTILIFFTMTAVGVAALGADKAPAAMNAVLASVNGEGITLEEILPMTRALENQAAAAYSGPQLTQAVLRFRKDALDTIIDRKLMVADYREREFRVTERDIESELDEMAERSGHRSRGEFIRKLREDGTSIEEVRKDVEERIICQVMIFQISHMENFITPEDVYKYYQEHMADFATPESVELAMIQLPAAGENALQVQQEVREVLKHSPEKFGQLAASFSTGPARENGGSLGRIAVKRIRPDFSAALREGIQEGKVYGPITTPEGIIWLKILKHYPPEEVDFAALSPRIRREMEQRQREKSMRAYTNRLRKNAIIRYYFDQDVNK